MIKVIDVDDSDEEYPGGINSESSFSPQNLQHRGIEEKNPKELDKIEIKAPIAIETERNIQTCIVVLSDSEGSGGESIIQPSSSNGSQQQQHNNKKFVPRITIKLPSTINEQALNALNDLRKVPKLSLKRKLDHENPSTFLWEPTVIYHPEDASSDAAIRISNTSEMLPEIHKPGVASDKIDTIYHTCGNCKAKIPLLYWKKHYNFHHSIAWRETVEPPIDTLNLKLLCFLMEHHKETNQLLHFKCEKCPETKLTALEVLLHSEYCGTVDDRRKEECSKCKINLMPFSFQDHVFRNKCFIQTDGGTVADSSDDDMQIPTVSFKKSIIKQCIINGTGPEKDAEVTVTVNENNTNNSDHAVLPKKVYSTCGNCKKRISKDLWIKHYDFHYSIAWRIGLDEVIDLENHNLVCLLMERFQKETSLKFFTCDKCLNVKKSTAIEMLMHMQLCGRTAEEIESLKKERLSCQQKYLRYNLQQNKTEKLALSQLIRLEVQILKPAQQQVKEVLPKVVPYKWIKRVEADKLSLHRMEKYLKSFEETSNQADANKELPSNYTCGSCRNPVATNNWLGHFKSHNGLAWRLNVDCPIDLTKMKRMIKVVATFKILNQLKQLVCDKCFMIKKRPIDYVKHVMVCKEARLVENISEHASECDHCKIKIKDTDLSQHVRVCPKLQRYSKDVGDKEVELTNADDLLEEIVSKAVVSEPNRLKRDDTDSDNSNSSSGLPLIQIKNQSIIDKNIEKDSDNSDSLPLITIRTQSSEKTNDDKTDFSDVDIKTEIEEGNYTLSSTSYQNFVNGSTNEDETPTNTYTCGNCKAEVPKSKWPKHLYFHNGLAWKEGVQPPINLTNLKSTTRILLHFMRVNKLAKLKCDGCSVARKSAVGLLGHLVKCSLQPVVCIRCKKKILSAGMTTHLANHCNGPDGSDEGMRTTKADNWTDNLVNKAILVAETKVTPAMLKVWGKKIRLKQPAQCQYKPDCKFESNTILEMANHLPVCSIQQKNLLTCKLCKFNSESYASIFLHIKQQHHVEDVEALKNDTTPSAERDLACEDVVRNNAVGVTSSNEGPLQTLDPRVEPTLHTVVETTPSLVVIKTEPEISDSIEFAASAEICFVGVKEDIDIPSTDYAITDNAQTEIKEEVGNEDDSESLNTTRRKLKQRKVIEDASSPSDSPQFTCGNCRGSISKDEWTDHIDFHNGLAWKVGIDKCIDMTNRTNVATQIAKYMKKNNVTVLKCEKCSIRKRSAHGMASHMEKSCPMLSKNIIVAPPKKEVSKKVVVDDDPEAWIKELIITTNTKAATKEMKKIWRQQFRTDALHVAFCFNAPACTFKASAMPELKKHAPKCRVASQKLFFCKMCNSRFNTYLDIYKHILTRHKTCEIAWRKKHNLEPAKPAKRVDSLNKSGSISGDQELQRKILGTAVQRMNDKKTQFHKTTYKWTKAFRTEFFAKTTLFSEFAYDAGDVRYLSDGEADTFLPVLKESLRFSHMLHEKFSLDSNSLHVDDWNRLKLMESCVEAGSATLFCGGPITALDWATFPPDYTGPEMLAVCCKPNPNHYLRLTDNSLQNFLIQIWNIGNIKNSTNLTKNPELNYSIACDNGPIQEIKFCPSGGFCSVTNRLGLLAVTSAVGCIYIYALPFSLDVKESKAPIISLKPVKVLSLDVTNESPDQLVTCLSWTNGANHTLISAGFSNGLAAVWDLNSDSPLLTFKKNDLNGIYPIRVVQSNQACITAIKFHQVSNTRYLMTVGLDRKIKVYDLDSSFIPLEISSDVVRSRVLSADWNLNWTAFQVGIDESLSLDRSGIFLKHPHDIGERMECLVSTMSSVYDVNCNEWSNECICVTESGEICSMRSKQMLVNVMGKFIWQNRLVFGYTDIVLLDESKVIDRLSEDYDYNDDSGIVFCDLDLAPDYSMTGLNIKNLRSRTIVGFPFCRINRIRCNQNQLSYQFYAIGYQTGFVRIKKLNHDNE